MNKEAEKESLHKGKSKRTLQKIMRNKAEQFSQLERDVLEHTAIALFSENFDLREANKQYEQTILELEFKLRKLEFTKKKEITEQQQQEELPNIILIKDIIRQRKKVMTSKSVSRQLLVLRPHLSQQWEDLQKRVSDYLSRLASSGELKRYRSNGNSGYYYGLPEWFSEQGKIKSNFGT